MLGEQADVLPAREFDALSQGKGSFLKPHTDNRDKGILFLQMISAGPLTK